MGADRGSYKYRKTTASHSTASNRHSTSRTGSRRNYFSANTSPSGYTRASMGNPSAREYGRYNSTYNNYNQGSLAHDYYYDTDIPVRKVRKRKVKHIQEKEIIQLNMPKTIVSIAVIFTFSLALLCTYAINSSYRSEIATKQTELAKIIEENEYLKTTLEDNVDLTKVAREAEKLGLQKPQAYQITEVQVPNESYTVQYDAKINTQDKSVWEFLKSLL